MTGGKFLKVKVVAKYLSCSTDYIYALIRNGNLEAVNLGERQTRIPEKSLREFVKGKRIAPADDIDAAQDDDF
jgi:excisionase family DNA binding protein